MERGYVTVLDGEFVAPIHKDYLLSCCDCGLCHVVNFYIRKSGRQKHIIMRIVRDNRRTASVRRSMQKKGWVSIKQTATTRKPRRKPRLSRRSG